MSSKFIGKPILIEEISRLGPAESKAFTKKMKDKITPGFSNLRIGMMRGVLICKFEQNKDLMKKLLDTGTEDLVEGNNWRDTFWGQCPVGFGKNNLGKLLMEIRDGERHFRKIRYNMEKNNERNASENNSEST